MVVERSSEEGDISLCEVPITSVSLEEEEEEEDERNFDSGVALQLPAWDGHPLVGGWGYLELVKKQQQYFNSCYSDAHIMKLILNLWFDIQGYLLHTRLFYGQDWVRKQIHIHS